MPKVYRIELTLEQREELKRTASRHKKPFMRERASGILKVADRNSLRQVAYHQLLTRHAPETVKGWCEAYLAQGLAGLEIRKGRGRKPVFSPSDENRSGTSS